MYFSINFYSAISTKLNLHPTWIHCQVDYTVSMWTILLISIRLIVQLETTIALADRYKPINCLIYIIMMIVVIVLYIDNELAINANSVK